MASPQLYDLVPQKLGLRRWLHGLVDLPTPSMFRPSVWLFGLRVYRLLLRVAARLIEIQWAVIADMVTTVRGRDTRLRNIANGDASRPDRRSIALYVHFSTSGIVSEMVLRQVEEYNRLGFEVIFISNAHSLTDASWEAVRKRVALAVHRRNYGYDFGAWKDLSAEALKRWPDATELLLVNDSVLGPLHPLDSALATMRGGGDGVFGLLESLQGGTHLQSWFVLARGSRAIADTAAFLDALRLSASKWKVIQRGELRLARHMLHLGHKVAAIHSYRKLLDETLADPEERAYLAEMLPFLAPLAKLTTPEATQLLRQKLISRPLNPAHHLWRVLARHQEAAFLKTELIRRNPGQIPGVEETWKTVVQSNTTCPLPIIEAHLATL